MLDRQSLVNVTLMIRTKFHSNRLVRFRDILHAVSKDLVSRKTRLKFSERHFSYVSFTYFFYLYTAALTPKVIFESHDLHFMILLKVVNSDTDSIILYPRIYHYTPK